MARKYELRKRARSQLETRQKIVEAAVELHGSLGPAKTTISAIAEKAGVQRLTVYRHFPDERSIFRACTGHFFEVHPMPDAQSWRAVDDPTERLRRGLAELFDYWRENETMFALAYRDADHVPAAFDVSPFPSRWQALLDALCEGRTGSGARGEVERAALAHAIDFPTWQALVRRGGLTHEQAIALLVCMVDCGARADSGGAQALV
jgi:AcrR family transcriptional regulator